MILGSKMYRVCRTDGSAVYNKCFRGTSVRAVDAPVRLPRDPAHPRALHGRADRARAQRAARAHGPAHPGPVRQLRRAARAGARRARGPLAPRRRRPREGAAAVAAQVRLQRRREVRLARHAHRARAAHRRALRLQRQVRTAALLSNLFYFKFGHLHSLFILIDICNLQCSPRDDEGSVRELRRAEDDRRGGADAAQGVDAQDPAAHRVAPQVHLRQAHHRETREILHESAGTGAYRAAASEPCAVVCVKY